MPEGRRVIFAGPTSVGLTKQLPPGGTFELLPPARRGDIAALAVLPPGLLVLVDGRFHESLSVGHAELRLAIERGWAVWGLGSLGAIRAFEMRYMGMKGFGLIYEHLLGEEDFQDDEVALLHAPDHPYLPVSEPLIHLRYFIACLEDEGTLQRTNAQLIVDDLKGMWFGERTLETTVSLIERRAGAPAAARARAWLETFGRFRIKSHDLATFLESEIWLALDYRPVPKAMPYGTRVAF